jgi:intracellular sulfur oxidation DsrE/DsrF family protein
MSCYHLGTVNETTVFKEENNMKTIAMKQQNKVHYPVCPNAADREYYLHKLLDGLLAVATCFGAIVAFLFLLFL